MYVHYHNRLEYTYEFIFSFILTSEQAHEFF